MKALAISAALLLAGGAGADQALRPGVAVPVTIMQVVDGDTVRVREYSKAIRLASIDAPETSHGRRKPGQPFSQAARRALVDLVANRPITAKCFERDRYERPVCELFGGERSINRGMVVAGMAWANTANRRYLRDGRLINDQQEARSKKLGLWAQPAIAPWEWRSHCWKVGDCPAPE